MQGRSGVCRAMGGGDVAMRVLGGSGIVTRRTCLSYFHFPPAHPKFHSAFLLGQKS